mgnify:FL=1
MISDKKDVFADAWRNFTTGEWKAEVNVRDFIQNNYTPYEGDDSFLEDATLATKELWDKVMVGIKQENATHAPLDFDNEIAATVTSHGAGYIDRELETVVGLQTDAPLKRAIICNGGIRMAETSCMVYGKELNSLISKIFSEYRKTHNAGVFDVYTPDIKAARKSGIITGLPDAYGRGRIIGDYRRVALYGIDLLIKDKKGQHASLDRPITECATSAELESKLRLREELAEQVRALQDMKTMAMAYGFDISMPAATAQEAVQWTYFGYLAAIKSQNGAAMSLGRVATFLDIYLQRDIDEGKLTEKKAQELIDHFVMKLRMVRFLRTPEYDELFSGDPIWATESIGGMGLDGRTLVTRSCFRFLHTLYTMGPSPEPNITVLWSEQMPANFKRFCAKVSIDTSSIQYENDDLMRNDLNSDDYAIACCVSPMVIGKQMQFFGARCNLAKALLYAINGGVDEKLKVQIAPPTERLTGDVLDYDEVMARFDTIMDWLAKQYVLALNCIHFMHDKYAYETPQMALHDRDVERKLACGIAGLSICADSLSAIKYAKVRPIRDENGIAINYEREGDFPTFGNNDPKVDSIASMLVETFMKKIMAQPIYRNAIPTQSILTITSNVVYGKKTGATPGGRLAGEPFAPGANPMYGRDTKGVVASLASVASLPYEYAKDGISYTFSIVPKALGKARDKQEENLVGLLDGYFAHDENQQSGQHVNINVMNREMLLEAMEKPENFPQLTIRVSGYAVRFNALTREQQQDVVARTFTASL